MLMAMLFPRNSIPMKSRVDSFQSFSAKIVEYCKAQMGKIKVNVSSMDRGCSESLNSITSRARNVPVRFDHRVGN